MIAEYRYDRAKILLHWTTAVLSAVGWMLGRIVDAFGRAGEPPISSMHITLGLMLIPVQRGRIALRLPGRSGPPIDTGVVAMLARILHSVLYFR